MTWPPEGSKPPIPPRPASTDKPRPQRSSPPPSPGETAGEAKVKPQVTPTPPQFQHQPIDLNKAAIFSGLLFSVCVAVLFVLSGSPWVLVIGIGGAFLAGGVVLFVRRSPRARGLLRRVPGVNRAGAALRRLPSGRVARSPFGRAISRVIGRRPAGGGQSGSTRTGGPSGGRPRGLGGRLRAALPSWAGGTRGQRPGGSPTARGGSPAGGLRQRARAALGRLTPGGRRRAAAAAAGGGSGGQSRAPGGRGSSPRASGAPTGRKPTGGRAGGTVSQSRAHARPTAGGRSADKAKAAFAAVATAKAVKRKAGALGSALGLLHDATTERSTTKNGGFVVVSSNLYLPRRSDKEQTEQEEEATPAHKPITPPSVSEVAQKARRRAKKRAEQAKTAESEPEYPDYDVDDYAPKSEQKPPERSLPAERDHDPPPSPPASPPSHREKKRETPRITSTNTGGRAMAVSPTMFNDLITSAATRREGWEVGADAFRRKASEFDEKAKDHDNAARALRTAGDAEGAEKQEEDARRLRDDANTCKTYAGKLQEKANAEATAA